MPFLKTPEIITINGSVSVLTDIDGRSAQCAILVLLKWRMELSSTRQSFKKICDKSRF